MGNRADWDTESGMAGGLVRPSRAALTRRALGPLLMGAIMAGSLNIVGAAAPVWAEVMPSSSTPEKAAQLSQVSVMIEGFRNDQGDALLALFRVASDFPTEPERAE